MGFWCSPGISSLGFSRIVLCGALGLSRCLLFGVWSSTGVSFWNFAALQAFGVLESSFCTGGLGVRRGQLRDSRDSLPDPLAWQGWSSPSRGCSECKSGIPPGKAAPGTKPSLLELWSSCGAEPGWENLAPKIWLQSQGEQSPLPALSVIPAVTLLWEWFSLSRNSHGIDGFVPRDCTTRASRELSCGLRSPRFIPGDKRTQDS